MKSFRFFKNNTSRIAKKLFDTFKKDNSLNQKDKKIKRIESGRTMMEMLGVLAVVGVLSVGGILGYKYGITKWKANETVNELNLRAHDIAFRMEKLIELDHEGEIEMEMGNVTRLGYPIMARMSPQYVDYFEMFLSDVPSDVCKELLKSQWQAPYSIFVGVTEYEATADICDQAENVELAYEFYKDLSRKEEVPEESRHKIQRCNHDNNCKCGTCNEQHGLCESFCIDSESCAKDYDDPRWMVCCDKNYVVNGFCCASITEDGQCCNRSGQCCPTDKPLQDKDGKCYSCEQQGKVNVTGQTKNCSACSGRFLSGNYCMLCGNNEFADTNGNCRSCTSAGNYYVQASATECAKCSERTFGYNGNDKCMLNCDTPGTYTEGKPLANIDGICYACSEPNAINLGSWGDNSRCTTLCPNRTLVGSNCVINKCSGKTPLYDSSMQCASCDTTAALPEQAACSTACNGTRENRKSPFGASGTYCVLKECPKGYFAESYGRCAPCTESGNWYVFATAAECAKCSERTFGYNNNDKCMVTCDTPGTYTEGKPLANVDGICYACDYPNAINLGNWGDNSRCTTLCKNRTLVGSHCVLNKCSGKTPLYDSSMQCVSCDTTAALPEQEVCSSACNGTRENLTSSHGTYCVLKECPKGYFAEFYGRCTPCTESGSYYVKSSATECAKCSERTFGYNGKNKCMVTCDTPGTYTEGKPLANVDGICYACDEPNAINLGSWGDNSRCTTLCPNRKLQGSNCVFKTCPDTKRLLGKNKVCYPCNIQENIPVESEEDCKKCMNRTYKSGYCYPFEAK